MIFKFTSVRQAVAPAVIKFKKADMVGAVGSAGGAPLPPNLYRRSLRRVGLVMTLTSYARRSQHMGQRGIRSIEAAGVCFCDRAGHGVAVNTWGKSNEQMSGFVIQLALV